MHRYSALADQIVHAEIRRDQKFCIIAWMTAVQKAAAITLILHRHYAERHRDSDRRLCKIQYNKLNLGDINGIPRVLDAGQCNDPTLLP